MINLELKKYRKMEIYSIKRRCKNKPIIKRYKIKCSSGTYVRGLTNKIGKDLGIGACALEIKRTKIII